MKNSNKPYFTFADWKFCPTTGQVQSLTQAADEQSAITLRAKLNQVLILLVDANGQVVTKQTLIDEIWQGNELIGNKGLVDTISALRKTLGKYQDQPLIKTHPKLGYSLTAAVTEHQAETIREVVTDPNTWLKPALYSFAVICIATLLFWKFGYNGQPQGKQQLKLELLLTNQAGMKRWPTKTHDGQWLAYVSYFDNPQGDLFIQDSEGKVTKLNSDSGNGQKPMIISPVWSPDGTLLAYIKQGSTDECQLNVYDRRLRVSHSLSECRFSGFGGLSWSPDSRYIYFNGVHEDQASYLSLQIEQDKVEPLFALADGELEVSYAKWLDDNTLYFVKAKSHMENVLMKYDVTTKTSQEIKAHGPVMGLALHPSEPIVTVAEALSESNFAVFDTNTQTGKVTQLDVDGLFLDISYLPDGKLILSKYQSKQGIIAADVATGKQRMAISSVGWNRFPHYSKARQALTFQSNRNGSIEIWQYQPNNQRISQLTDNDVGEYFHHFSPDGTKMAFVGLKFEGGSVLNLHVFDVGSGITEKLNNDKVESMTPVWSEDGSQITIVKPSQENMNGVFAVDVASKESVEIVGLQSPELVQYAGGHLYYFNSNTGFVTRFDPHGEDILLAEQIQTLDWANWVVTDSELYYVVRGDSDEVRVMDFATGQIRTVVTLTSGSIFLSRSLTFDSENGVLYICINQSEDGNIGVYSKVVAQ